MTEAGWTPNSEVESAIDELKAQVQKIYNAGYQQGRVVGLREAEDYAERCVKERQLQLLNLGDQAALDPNDRRPGWIRCKASEARRIQVWCARQTQQAQAAQDEKGVGDGN